MVARTGRSVLCIAESDFLAPCYHIGVIHRVCQGDVGDDSGETVERIYHPRRRFENRRQLSTTPGDVACSRCDACTADAW